MRGASIYPIPLRQRAEISPVGAYTKLQSDSKILITNRKMEQNRFNTADLRHLVKVQWDGTWANANNNNTDESNTYQLLFGSPEHPHLVDDNVHAF